MIPDFPKLNKRFLNAIKIYSINKSPTSKSIFEGNIIRIENDDGWVNETSISEIASKRVLKSDFNTNSFFEVIDTVVNINIDMSNKRDELIFDVFSETTDITGKKSDAKGNFTPKLFLDDIKIVDFFFDDFGNGFAFILFERIDSTRYISKVIITADNRLELINFDPEHEKIIRNELKSNSGYKIQIDDIIWEKRENWNDKESNRKLVD